jgi:hypothetical protein
MRNAIHGFFLPVWPAGSTRTSLDKVRSALDSLLKEYRDDVAAVYEDKYLSAEGRAAKLRALKQRIEPLVDDMRGRVAGARLTYAEKAYALDGFSRAKNTVEALVDELRRRQIRDHFATMTGEERYLTLDTAIRDGDAETMQAVVQAPSVRSSLVTPQQREAARRALWRNADPDTAADQEQLAAQIPVFEATLTDLEQQMLRLASGDERDFAAFEGNRAAAEGFQEWWRTRNDDAGAVGDNDITPPGEEVAA